MPVLSNAIVFAEANFSTIVPDLITTIPATKAIGADRIKGHGEATTKTSAKRVGLFETNQATPAIK